MIQLALLPKSLPPPPSRKVLKAHNKLAKDMKPVFASPPCERSIPDSQPKAALRTPQDATEALAKRVHPAQASQRSDRDIETSLNKASSATVQRFKPVGGEVRKSLQRSKEAVFCHECTSRVSLPVSCAGERKASTAATGRRVRGLKGYCEHFYDLCVLLRDYNDVQSRNTCLSVRFGLIPFAEKKGAA